MGPDSSRTDRHPAGGFTLVELMVTVATLLVLTGLAVPTYARLQRSSYDAMALSDAVNAVRAVLGQDGRATYSVTVRGRSAIRQLPGPMVSQGTTLLVSRTLNRRGDFVIRVRASHARGTPRLQYLFQNGQFFVNNRPLG